MKTKRLTIATLLLLSLILAICVSAAPRLYRGKKVSHPDTNIPAFNRSSGKEADRARKAALRQQRALSGTIQATWAYPAPDGSCILETYNDDGTVFVVCDKNGRPKSEYFTIPNYDNGNVWLMQFNGRYILIDDYSSGSPEKVVLYKVGSKGLKMIGEQSVYYVSDGFLSGKHATVVYYSDSSLSCWGLKAYDLKMNEVMNEGPYDYYYSDFFWFVGCGDVYQVWLYTDDGWSLRVRTPEKVLSTTTMTW